MLGGTCFTPQKNHNRPNSSGRCGCFAWNLCSPPQKNKNKIHRVNPHATPEATRHSHRKHTSRRRGSQRGAKPPTPHSQPRAAGKRWKTTAHAGRAAAAARRRTLTRRGGAPPPEHLHLFTLSDMSPSPLLARPPAPSSPSTYPSLPPRRCAPAVASAALRVAPATASRAPFSR